MITMLAFLFRQQKLLKLCIVKWDSEYVDDSDDVRLSNLVVKKLCLEIE